MPFKMFMPKKGLRLFMTANIVQLKCLEREIKMRYHFVLRVKDLNIGTRTFEYKRYTIDSLIQGAYSRTSIDLS